ncbi:zinc finger, CCHC-type containing protein [Tanacetum coccineum]
MFTKRSIRQRHVDNDPGVSATSELFALACGPTPTPISVNSCVVNGVRFVVHNRDERRTTQNSGICSPGGNDGEMYYGQLQEILEFSYLSFKVVLFRVKWFDTRNEGRKVQRLVLRNNMTQILTKDEAFKDDQYILATQVKQCFYLEDMARRPPHWKVVEHVNHKKFSDGGVIVVEEDPDVIHFDNSSDLPLSTSLNDLNNATLHIDGQSTEVDAPPDIIDLDEDDDIIDDEDALPHDLADSDDEDLVNVEDDDGVEVMSADVARGHGGDGGGDDRPPSHHIPTGCGGCFANRGKGTRKANLGGRKAGRLHTRQETRNLGLKKITDDKGPVPIRFEWDDKKTMMPLGGHASHWSNYLGELIREMPLYYPSWQKVPAERKAAIVTKIGEPLCLASITEDGVTRHKEYVELTPAETPYKLIVTSRAQSTSFSKPSNRNLMAPFNTKFLNTLPDEWSKFATDVKLVKDLHTTNIDQLHAYLQQHERHANEVHLMHERNTDPLALVFQKRDDPIDVINHMMSFLTVVVTSRYPTTSNQLRTSSNPRQQVTIYDGQVTVQPVQGRQTTYAAGTTRKYTPGASGSNTGKQWTVICYNCKGRVNIVLEAVYMTQREKG